MCDRWTDVLSMLILQGLLIRELGPLGVLLAVLVALIVVLVGAAQLQARQRHSEPPVSRVDVAQQTTPVVSDAMVAAMERDVQQLSFKRNRSQSASRISSTTSPSPPITRSRSRPPLPR